MHKLLLFLGLIFGIGGFSAQEVVLDSIVPLYQKTQRPVDSLINTGYQTNTPLVSRHFSPDFQNKYQSKDFDYTSVKPRESLSSKIERMLNKILELIFGKVDPHKVHNSANLIFRLLAIVIIGLVLYFVLKVWIGKEGNFFFGKKSKKIKIQVGDLSENIHEIDFQQSIAHFETKEEYRYALRYQFLRLLKRLADKNLIAWNPEKTNRDYLKELKKPLLKENFRSLSYIFENVWYGEYAIDAETYHVFKKKFEEFNF